MVMRRLRFELTHLPWAPVVPGIAGKIRAREATSPRKFLSMTEVDGSLLGLYVAGFLLPVRYVERPLVGVVVCD